MSEIEVDFSEFRWCNASALDELEQTTEIVEVLGYEQFLKLPVSEEYEKNKQMREERIKQDILKAKARNDELIYEAIDNIVGELDDLEPENNPPSEK